MIIFLGKQEVPNSNSCSTISAEECCKYVDGRIGTAVYRSPCILRKNHHTPCMALCWATNTCDGATSTPTEISDYCGTNGRKHRIILLYNGLSRFYCIQSAKKSIYSLFRSSVDSW